MGDPDPGAAEELAGAFGLILINGFTYPTDIYAPIEFSTTDGSLRSHPIITGRAGKGEEVTSVLTFTGQAMRRRPVKTLCDSSSTAPLRKTSDVVFLPLWLMTIR